MKYIIFDIDGTLTDTTDIDDKCYIESFENLFNVSIKEIKWSQLKNVTDWGIAEELISIKLKKNSSQSDIETLKNLFLNKIKDEFRINTVSYTHLTLPTTPYV